MFKDKKIILIVSGGIASYKSIIFLRLLIKKSAKVKVVMTKTAIEFINPKIFETLSKNEVIIDLFKSNYKIPHVQLSQWADYIYIIPATANIIGKMANGIADDTATTLLIASNSLTFIVPAMNDIMYNNNVVQRNIQQLEKDGNIIIEPDVGELAEGYYAKGRMKEPEEILKESEKYFKEINKNFIGKHILVTSGGTMEPIDPVRYISNKSSGKMGNSFAEIANLMGANVTLITTTDFKDKQNINVIKVKTAQEMFDQIKQIYSEIDIIIMAAAISDYKVDNIAENKIKKNKDKKELILNLIQTPDILTYLSDHKTKQYIVGFAAESNNLLEYAKKKLYAKKLDMILANDISQDNIGFEVDYNQFIIINKNNKIIETKIETKLKLAENILDMINLEIKKNI